LHTYYANFVNKELGGREGQNSVRTVRHHKKIGFDVFEYGLIKRRVYEGGSEEDTEWKDGHPLVFPNWLSVGNAQIRVPVDDTMTKIWYYHDHAFPAGFKVPEQTEIPVYQIDLYDENGNWIVDTVEGQDQMAWITQGEIADRSEEHVGASDRGVLLYRKLLQEELLKVEQGLDPMGVIRDPAKNVSISLPLEHRERTPRTAAEARQMVGRPGTAQAPKELMELLYEMTLEAYHIEAA
jgi:5,5'-dehydrodivanillate O-demethylase